MPWNRKLSPRTTCIVLVLVIPIALLLAIAVNPQARNKIVLRKYLKSIDADWKEFREMNPELGELELKVTTRPSLLILDQLPLGTDHRPLEEFFTTRQPPESTPLTITLNFEENGTWVDRYHRQFPGDSESEWRGNLNLLHIKENKDAEQVEDSNAGHAPG